MSYEIYYNKQFIKLRRTGEVIPMLLAGSNNCFEIGRNGRTGRRTREWCSDRYYNRKGKLSEKPEIILKKLQAELRRRIRDRHDEETKPADIRKRFGYYAAIVVGSGHCADTSWADYFGLYANGIKKALTIEELDALGVNPYFDAFVWRVNEDQPEPPPKPSGVNLKTERDYFVELKKWREWQAVAGKSFYLTFSPLSTDGVLARLRANNRRVPKEHTRVEQDHYFVLAGEDGYLVKYTRRGFRYSFQSSNGCKRFRTDTEANRYLQQLLKRGRYKADIWKVERVDLPATFWV